jgi:hypothetical protein
MHLGVIRNESVKCGIVFFCVASQKKVLRLGRKDGEDRMGVAGFRGVVKSLRSSIRSGERFWLRRRIAIWRFGFVLAGSGEDEKREQRSICEKFCLCQACVGR